MNIYREIKLICTPDEKEFCNRIKEIVTEFQEKGYEPEIQYSHAVFNGALSFSAIILAKL
jgi:hypothetical protein